MQRLRDECADVVSTYSADQLYGLALTYSAAYNDIETREEAEWYEPFADIGLDEIDGDFLTGAFRETLAAAIRTPGNVFWGDHLTLTIISDLYRIVFLSVVDDGNVVVTPSNYVYEFLYEYEQSGDLGDAKFGFLRNLGATYFDAICYTPVGHTQCLAAMDKTFLAQQPEIEKLIKDLLPKGGMFPVPIDALKKAKAKDVVREDVAFNERKVKPTSKTKTKGLKKRTKR